MLRTLLVPLVLALLAITGTANAARLGASIDGGATLSAAPAEFVVAPGASIDLEIILDLADGEDASVFEAAFEISISGDVTAVDFGIGDASTWDAPLANCDPGGSCSVSLLGFANLGGARNVGTYSIGFGTVGRVDVFLATRDVLLERDLDTAPFIEALDFNRPPDNLIASIVTPEPGTAILLGLGLLGLGGLRSPTTSGIRPAPRS